MSVLCLIFTLCVAQVTSSSIGMKTMGHDEMDDWRTMEDFRDINLELERDEMWDEVDHSELSYDDRFENEEENMFDRDFDEAFDSKNFDQRVNIADFSINLEEIDAEQLIPLNVTESEQLIPLNVTESEQLIPLNVTESEQLIPLNVTESEQLIPLNVTGSEQLIPLNTTEPDASELYQFN